MRLLVALLGLLAVGGGLAGCSAGLDGFYGDVLSRCRSSGGRSLADAPDSSEGDLLLCADTSTDAPRPADEPIPLEEMAEREEPVPAEQQRGPAYPGEFWHSFGHDAKEFVPVMAYDAKATATNPSSLVMLAAAGITGAALSGGCGNDQVQEHYERHGSGLNTFWDAAGDVAGNPGTHFGFAGAMYFASLAQEDTKHYEVSKTLLSALALNGLTTLALKGVARTEVPNGEEFGWPSGHTSSSFCFATVMQEAYGSWVGVPLFALAGFVGYERIDARNHDFSDVVSGALIGLAIGHAVSQNHEARIFGMEVLPYTDPERGAVGVMLTRQW